MTKIELHLDRTDVSVEQFAEALLAQVELVRQVMTAMGYPAQDVRWVVSDLRYGSTYAAGSPQALGERVFMADIDRAIIAAGQGMRTLTQSAKRPEYFSDEALKTSRRLLQITSEFDTGRARLVFGGVDVSPTPAAAANVENIIKGDLQSIGSIEGTLVGVSVGDGTYRISIKDRLTNRRIPCNIPGDQLPRALGAFESRVVVRGLITSRQDGTAIRIDARALDVMPADSELPTRDDVKGILHDFRRADGE